MKIFGYNLSSGSNLSITEDDRHWVEDNFKWMKDVFGYPNTKEEQILLSENWFPATFSKRRFEIEFAIADLCKLFNIPRNTVTLELMTDLRDTVNTPYEISGKAFECETQLKKGDHKIFVAKSLVKHPERLIYNLIYEFIRIRLNENEVQFDEDSEDAALFIYLAGIYFGVGIILAQNLLYAGRSNDGLWEIKWNYGSEMAQPVMAFALATYANMRGERNPAWKSEFKGDFKKMLEDSLAFLQMNPSGLLDENEVEASNLFHQANGHYERKEWDDGISSLQKILFLTKEDLMKADVYNSIGYNYLRKHDYQQGISNFRKALSISPEYGFANDNLGYGLIISGELEEGFSYLEVAMKTANNNPAYTFRNLGLYHLLNKNFDMAEEYFGKAFDQKTPVDLLEYHYGEFLAIQGDLDKAREFFQKSADSGEEEGIRKLLELNTGKR